MYRTYKRIAVLLCGRFATLRGFKKLQPWMEASGMRILLKTYVSMLILTTLLAFVISLSVTLTVLVAVHASMGLIAMLGVSVPIFTSFTAFMVLYAYPSQRAKAVKRSIDKDLPFAISHMSAISSSGIPPEAMFDLLTGFNEYREISRHASLIVRNIRTFGMSSVTAITAVAKTTPSRAFRQILNGIAFNIEKGGNLTLYLKEMAEKALFDYRIKREKYMKTLAMYADIYTAILVAAPLMMLAVLGILSVIGGEILGLTINDAITLLTFVALPAMNIAFLVFLQLTYQD